MQAFLKVSSMFCLQFHLGSRITRVPRLYIGRWNSGNFVLVVNSISSVLALFIALILTLLNARTYCFWGGRTATSRRLHNRLKVSRVFFFFHKAGFTFDNYHHWDYPRSKPLTHSPPRWRGSAYKLAYSEPHEKILSESYPELAPMFLGRNLTGSRRFTCSYNDNASMVSLETALRSMTTISTA